MVAMTVIYMIIKIEWLLSWFKYLKRKLKKQKTL